MGAKQSSNDAVNSQDDRNRSRNPHRTLSSTSSAFGGWKKKTPRGPAVIAKWQQRQFPEQLFAVVRHAERADGAFAFFRGGRWTQSEDFENWPLDPPLSDNGLEGAGDIGAELQSFAEDTGSKFHVVVSSPYARCLQTAVEICMHLGGNVRLIVDRSIGEVYGPSVMGNCEPRHTVRPISNAVEYCRSLGLKLSTKVIGVQPKWPEDLKTARHRYANRFLTYLQRSCQAKRNFILCTHADCVGAALHMMPSQVGKAISAVEYGGYFVGRRTVPGWASGVVESSKDNGGKRGFGGVLPAMPEGNDEENYEIEEIDSPRLWKSATTGFDEQPGPASSSKNGTSSSSKSRSRSWLPSVVGRTKTAQQPEPEASPEPPGEPEPPTAADGWRIEVANISLRPSAKEAKDGAVDKRLQAITKHSNGQFTRTQVESLLRDLSDLPLDVDERASPFSVAIRDDNSHNRRSYPSCSLSTYMFGASECGDNFSELGSEVSLTGFGSRSRVPTITDIATGRIQSLTSIDLQHSQTLTSIGQLQTPDATIEDLSAAMHSAFMAERVANLENFNAASGSDHINSSPQLPAQGIVINAPGRHSLPKKSCNATPLSSSSLTSVDLQRAVSPQGRGSLTNDGAESAPVPGPVRGSRHYSWTKNRRSLTISSGLGPQLAGLDEGQAITDWSEAKEPNSCRERKRENWADEDGLTPNTRAAHAAHIAAREVRRMSSGQGMAPKGTPAGYEMSREAQGQLNAANATSSGRGTSVSSACNSSHRSPSSSSGSRCGGDSGSDLTPGGRDWTSPKQHNRKEWRSGTCEQRVASPRQVQQPEQQQGPTIQLAPINCSKPESPAVVVALGSSSSSRHSPAASQEVQQSSSSSSSATPAAKRPVPPGTSPKDFTPVAPNHQNPFGMGTSPRVSREFGVGSGPATPSTPLDKASSLSPTDAMPRQGTAGSSDFSKQLSPRRSSEPLEALEAAARAHMAKRGEPGTGGSESRRGTKEAKFFSEPKSLPDTAEKKEAPPPQKSSQGRASGSLNEKKIGGGILSSSLMQRRKAAAAAAAAQTAGSDAAAAAVWKGDKDTEPLQIDTEQAMHTPSTAAPATSSLRSGHLASSPVDTPPLAGTPVPVEEQEKCLPAGREPMQHWAFDADAKGGQGAGDIGAEPHSAPVLVPRPPAAPPPGQASRGHRPHRAQGNLLRRHVDMLRGPDTPPAPAEAAAPLPYVPAPPTSPRPESTKGQGRRPVIGGSLMERRLGRERPFRPERLSEPDSAPG
eukprot:TRINITY_DN12784_c0_g1_i1.p1 TRINITY_DN12784_c0_g1~~TRINITY_DN12784_c0_g1_i1.p1  ORF type:complete len:1260 (+),score=230.98 TRINITY_DN12784_c0_g1_i1:148-3927(+)